jgi:hypothetical protein
MGGEYSQPKIRRFGASMIACAAGIGSLLAPASGWTAISTPIIAY